MIARPRIAYLTAAALLAGLVATAASAGEASYVRAGRLIDPQSGKVLTDRLIRVEDGKISTVTLTVPAQPEGN